MKILYLLLSPTFGMHQYTADLANQRVAAGDDVHLLTTLRYVADRYSPAVHVHATVDLVDTGLSVGSLDMVGLGRVLAELRKVGPDVVHITGPHVWNGLAMRWLRGQHVPVVHTIHDVEPHAEGSYGWLVRRWNQTILRQADCVLVHGRCYVDDLVSLGADAARITYSPLLHLFTSYAAQAMPSSPRREAVAGSVLCFGRLEAYKGIPDLLAAWALLQEQGASDIRLVLAGRGDLDAIWPHPLPPRVSLRNRHIEDSEAVALFEEAGLLVLPYRQATQSALIAAAYAANTPVIVSDSGALAEYVEPGETGWVTRSGDVPALMETLHRALRDPVRLGRMGRQGRAWYERERRKEQALLQEMYERVIR